MSRTSESWLHALRSHDAEAVADLRDLLRRSLARGFGKQVSDVDLDDLTQDAIVRILDSLERFEGRSSFTTWATAIAVNTALQELRRRRHVTVSLTDAVAAGAEFLEAPVGSATLERRQAYDALDAAIAEALTDRQRTALMVKLSGLPMTEISSRLGIKTNALYKLLHDARRRLRDHLQAQGMSASTLLEQP